MNQITYEKLYEVALNEKKEDLVMLPETFYTEITNIILIRKKLLEKDMSDEARTEIEEEIKNIKKLMVTIYGRREQKIIQSAMMCVKSNDSLSVRPNLLGVELELFNSCVDIFRLYRKRMIG